MRERIFGEFRAYSGGIDPLPWLAHAVGRTLLRRARATEKEFLWIKGERILYGYPHVGVEYPVHLETIEDARRYGEISESVVLGTDIQLADVENQRFALVRKLRETTDPEAQERIKRQLSKLGREMFRLQHQRETYSQSSDRVQKLYDRTAQNLGFRQWGKRPWHRYTKRVDTFGSTIRSRASDPSQFERSEGEMDHAFSFLIPDSD